MPKLSWRKPEQQPLLGEDTRMSWAKTTPPAPVTPSDKVGPVAPSTPRPVRARVGRWRQVAVPDTSQGQVWRMFELKARVADRLAAGEDPVEAFNAVKRELWPEEYRD